MFRSAQIKLTFFYSLFFLLFFAMTSWGIYAWMDNFLHQEYAGEIRQEYNHEAHEHDPWDIPQQWSHIAADIALKRFGLLLLLLNGGFLFLVPASIWILTGKSLHPVEESHEREKQFVSNIAHDLRTPLTVLQTEMEIALQKKRSEKEYHALLSSNKEEIYKLVLLVEDLLFLAKQDAKGSRVHFATLEITDIVGDAIAKIMPRAKEKKLPMEFEPSETNITIIGNKTMLTQLFTNLLDNAIKYTQKGKITVMIVEHNHFAVISVTDTGIGLTKEEQQRIFDRFYRSDQSRSQTQGYGLGLAICRTIVDAHKGKLLVTSEKGNGSTFTVLLPIGQKK